MLSIYPEMCSDTMNNVITPCDYLFLLTMEHQKVLHRDKVLHCYFAGRDWDKNDEYTLKRKLVLNRDRLFPQYPYDKSPFKLKMLYPNLIARVK